MRLRHPLARLLLACLPAWLSLGCGAAPGRPSEASIPVDPDKVSDFAALFQQNCSGCHGAEGNHGAALAIGDPVYLAIADDATLRKVVANGISGTSMPPFAQSAGGMLTAKQVDVLVSGIRQRWGRPAALAGVASPPYLASESGDAARGAGAFAVFCAGCHGADGKGTAKGSSIVDGTFLSLLTDQELRTLVIVGRPDLGGPDWRNNVPGRAMSSQEISDVVAWLAAQRPKFAGRPYPQTASSTGEKP
jgi:mono/diheme cytochrome c family protein